MVRIYLKDCSEKNVSHQNTVLETMGILDYKFQSREDIEREFYFFKNNPAKRPNWIPSDDMFDSLELFQKYYTKENYGEIFVPDSGTLIFDPYYDRTAQKDMFGIAKYLIANFNEIEIIKGNHDTFIERTEDLTDSDIKVLNKLCEEYVEPEKLPEEEQYKPSLQSGLFLCKSFSINPFWVVFGNVETPKFLKEKIYVNDLYNNIYKDKNGYAYMLLPLMKIGESEDWGDKIYEKAYNLGLREHPIFFLVYFYYYKLKNGEGFEGVSKELKEYYTKHELTERLEDIINQFANSDTLKLTWNDYKKEYTSYNHNPLKELATMLKLSLME